MNSIDKIVVSKAKFESNKNEVITLLKEYGVLIIPSFYSSETIENLNSEFSELLEQKQAYIKNVPYSDGKAAYALTKDLEKNIYPTTLETYNAPFMDALTEMYFCKKVKSNIGIYFVKDVVGSKHIANDLHFDVQQSLKFFIYLNDTSAENGAFYAVPGSHKEAQKLRKKYGSEINYENRELSRELPVKDSDAIPIEGKAGSLIIFDTDVFHKAGTVHKGERRVMRGYSEFVISSPPPKKSQLKESFLKRAIKKITG